jgi:hypothetical protein
MCFLEYDVGLTALSSNFPVKSATGKKRRGQFFALLARRAADLATNEEVIPKLWERDRNLSNV